MSAPTILRIFTAAAAIIVMTTAPLSAQTWHWQVVLHPANGAAVSAQSELTLSATGISMSYATKIHDRSVPIASCTARLADVATAQAVRNNERAFLLVRLKPRASATCDTGPQPLAALPVSDNGDLTSAAAAINRACCSSPVAAVRPSSPKPSPPAPKPLSSAPKPSPTDAPAPSPKPSPSAPKRGVLVTDWVQNDGVFFFVRVRSRYTEPVTIVDGSIANCRGVDYGCGRFANPTYTLKQGDVATLATVVGAGRPEAGPSFTYRFTVRLGDGTFVAGGSSTKRLTGWMPAIPPAELRQAEAAAIATLRDQGTTDAAAASPPSPAPLPTRTPASVGVRLTRRGSSRLAIGHTGVAQVRVSVTADGSPTNMAVVSVSDPQLVAAAIETAASSTYAPAVRNGKNVPGDYIATFKFDGLDPADASTPIWRRAVPASPAPSASP